MGRAANPPVRPSVRLGPADRHRHYSRVPDEVLEPSFDRLVATGYAVRTGDHLWLTQSGARQVDYVSTLILTWIVDKLARSPSFAKRADRGEVEAALERIAQRVLVQRNWDDDRTPPGAAGSVAVGSSPRTYT